MDIITTIGPSCWDPDVLAAQLRLGVTCLRFPFSKLQPEDHVSRCRLVRGIAQDLGIPVLTMADLPGGKPRLHSNHPIHVETTRPYRIARQRVRVADDEFWLEPGLPDVTFRPHDEVVIGDGENRFVVSAISTGHLTGTFSAPGTLEWQRAFIPAGVDLHVASFTDQDKRYAAFAHAAGFDWIALSYVSSSEDVVSARRWMSESLAWTPRVVAKIETAAGVRRAEAIARVADAVMVGRGDLALQVGVEQLWPTQKAIVDACRRTDTYCIAATGFLESLAHQRVPTRAECIDLCATVDMGVDAILFSHETSLGHDPILVIEMAQKLASTCWMETSV